MATVNSKSVITVNPGKRSEQRLQKQRGLSFQCARRRLLISRDLFSDTREASLLFSYVKEVSESGALDQDEAPEDLPGMFQ